MNTTGIQRNARSVAVWLLAGVCMIMIQVILGGVTRLTGSGLSITEWKPLLGVIPPLNEKDWGKAFDQYKQIGQYKLVNTHFTLEDFKFIYFWEWLHRLWGRLIGLAFVIPFVVFLLQKRFKPPMAYPMLILFLMGGLQGAIGWIMVKSGLNEENVRVSHIRLAIHFIAALGLLVCTFWFALRLLIDSTQNMFNASYRKYLFGILALLILQLVYGAFLAGLKGATYAPTWPMLNGHWLPHGGEPATGWQQFINNPITVQFIHRSLGYLLLLLILMWWMMTREVFGSRILRRAHAAPFFLVLLQILLGILTVVNSPFPNRLLWLGVAHQFTAMLLLLSLVLALFLSQSRPDN